MVMSTTGKQVAGLVSSNAVVHTLMKNNYFASRKQAVAISGDASAIEEDLSLFGKVEVVVP